MKVGYFYTIILILALSSAPGYAEIYVNEDFEQFADGDDIGKNSDFWEMTEPDDSPVGPGVASSKQAHSGKISALFDDGQCMGFPFANLNLPDNYVVSTWFYHDSTQSPPPDAIVTMIPDTYPGGGNFWMGIGTRIEALERENYTYRDKTATGIYEDTGIPRRTEWVQFVFIVQPDAMEFYVDGKKVYTAKIDTSRFTGYQLSRTPVWGKQTGEVFIDDVVIADTIDEIPLVQAVIANSKLAATWGGLKQTLTGF
jgi:hypothetical protein